MREHPDRKAENTRQAFRPMRAAVVALGVVVFLFAFRPFGLSIDSVEEALVLLGVAPLNFLIMLGLHHLPLRGASWRAVAAISSLVIGNTIYLALWSQGARTVETIVAVGLVVALTAIFVFLWNRGRIPEQELDNRRIDPSPDGQPVTLAGESDQEILKLGADELLFISANGNYVDVHYRRGEDVTRSMLRSSLTGLAAQVPAGLLVQCHRSHFVNLTVARRIVRAKGRTLIEFDGGARVPVSRMFRQDVFDAISG